MVRPNTEMRFRVNTVPGDGIQTGRRELMGRKRYAYAELIMRTGSRVTRRITTQQLRRPLKMDIADELRNAFSTKMYVTATEHSPHENKHRDWAHEEAGLLREAEKKGKVIRPRVDGGQEEDEIKKARLPRASGPRDSGRGHGRRESVRLAPVVLLNVVS